MNYLANITSLVKNNLHGIYWTILKCFIFSATTVLTSNFLINISPSQILFCSLIFRLILLSPWLIKKNFKQLKTTQLKYYLARSFLSTTAVMLWYKAIKLIAPSTAVALSYFGPIFTVIAAHFLLGESLTKIRITALLIGFFGMLIIIRPGINQFGLGEILVLITIPIWSIIDLIIKFQAKTEQLINQTFHNTICALIFTLPWAFKSWVTPNIGELLIIMLIGSLSLANNISLFLAYRAADLILIAPFTFTRLLFTCLFTYLLTQQQADFWQLLGSIIIIGSNVWIIYLEKRNLITKSN